MMANAKTIIISVIVATALSASVSADELVLRKRASAQDSALQNRAQKIQRPTQRQFNRQVRSENLQPRTQRAPKIAESTQNSPKIAESSARSAQKRVLRTPKISTGTATATATATASTASATQASANTAGLQLRGAQASAGSATSSATSTAKVASARSARVSNLSNALKSAPKVASKVASSAGTSALSSTLSNTTIALSSIGGTALAGGVGGGIYALTKKDDKKDGTFSAGTPIVYYDPPKVKIGIIDSGYNPNQISQPDKNFYNIGGGGKNDPSHGTKVAKSVRAHNTDSELYMYSARCGTNGICPNAGMYNKLYALDARIINGSWGAMANTAGTHIPMATLNAYYSDWMYYGMAKEAAAGKRIFVFAAGNQSSRHANNQSIIPLVVKATKNHASFDRKIWENSRRGWVAVTATNSWNNQLDTRYANWIGEEAQNWGIAVRPHNVGYGTSFSAPVVSGVLGNIWNKFPWMNNHLVVQTLLSTADKYTISANAINYNSSGDKWHSGVVTEGPNKKTGWGVLNKERALNGPARFDTRLLVPDDAGKVQINFEHQNYRDLNQLTFSNDIAGDAGVYKYGSGVLYMSGNNTYTGETHIDDGGIVLSNALTHSKVVINQLGTLRTQNLGFLPSGIAQPDSATLGRENSGYTITNYGNFEVFKNTMLYGDYLSKGASTLALDVDAKLDVKGKVDMNGGEFAFNSLSTIPLSNPQTKTLLTAQNGVQNWNNKWSLSPYSSAYLRVSSAVLNNSNKDLLVTYKRDSTRGVLARSLSYIPQNLRNIAQGIDNALDSLAKNTTHLANNAESNEKNLVILSASEESQKNTQNRDSSLRASHSAQNDNLRDFAESNAQSTQSKLDSATLTNDAFYTEALSLLAITQQDATNAVASLSGEIYDSNLSITHKSAMLLNRTIARRLYQINDGAQSGVWADISYARSTMQSKDFATGKIVQYAIMAGIDGMKAEKNSAFGGGALFSVDRAKGDFGVVGNSDMLSYALSLYGVVSYEKFYMLARIGAALHDTDVTRKLNFGSGTALQNKQKDISYHGYIEVGYNLDAGWFRLTPFVAWEEDLITRKKVSESGKNGSSNFSLVLDSAKYRVYSLIYGAKGHFKFGGFALEYSALDMFAPNPNKFRSNAKFSGGSNNFASSGIPQARNLVFLSLGASYAFSQLILRGEYSLSLNPDTSKMIEDEIINLNLRYNF